MADVPARGSLRQSQRRLLDQQIVEHEMPLTSTRQSYC
jgi:hypothetical protein